jgi:hypothetical protein
VKTTR